MDFSVNKQNNSISVKREFAAERPLVWDAFTKSEILDRWWAPKPWTARTKSMDFRENGRWHYAMVGPEGEEHWGLSLYAKIHALKSYAGTDAFADADAVINAEMPQSRFECTFEDKEASTLVTFQITYNDLAQLEATIQMGFKEGLTMAMEGLDEVLEAILASK